MRNSTEALASRRRSGGVSAILKRRRDASAFLRILAAIVLALGMFAAPTAHADAVPDDAHCASDDVSEDDHDGGGSHDHASQHAHCSAAACLGLLTWDGSALVAPSAESETLRPTDDAARRSRASRIFRPPRFNA